MIEVPEGRRLIDEKAMPGLMGSIAQVGVRQPITLTFNDDQTGYVLVVGAHRLEACTRLGMSRIRGVLQTTWTPDETRMWEITENLHRAELTALDRDEQIAEWAALVERRKGGQVAHLSKGGRGNESGAALASREPAPG